MYDRTNLRGNRQRDHRPSINPGFVEESKKIIIDDYKQGIFIAEIARIRHYSVKMIRRVLDEAGLRVGGSIEDFDNCDCPWLT